MDYETLRKELNELLPRDIVDCHVHTATYMPEIDYSVKEFHPLSHAILNNRTLNVRKDTFSRIFPDKKIHLLGFPLPVPHRFKNPDISGWNKLIIEQKKKNLIQGCLLHLDINENLQSALDFAEQNKVKVNGIKIHPRIAVWKPKKEVLVKDLVTDGFLDLAEKNKLSLNLELSHGLCKEDVLELKKIDNNYNINVVLPHCTLNYRNWVMTQQEYDNTFDKDCFEYEKEFFSLRETNSIFMDASMVMDRRAVSAAISTLGEDKIFYGSDYPFCFTPKIKELRPDSEIVGKILKEIIDGNYYDNELWKFDYSLLVMINTIVHGMKISKVDCYDKVFQKNARNAYSIN